MKIIRLLLIPFLALCLLSGVASIRPEERAVIKRFGKIVAKPGPGLWIGLPFGIDRVERIPIATVRRITIGYQPDWDETPGLLSGQLLTGDQNLVNTQIAIDYTVAEGDDALEDYVLQKESLEGIVVRESEALIAEWMSCHTVDEVLLRGNAELPRWLMQTLPPRLDPHHLGIRISQMTVSYLTPPDSVRAAFEEVTRSQTQMRTQEYRARQESERLQKNALAEKFRYVSEAKAYELAKNSSAQAEAAAFLARMESYHRLRLNNPEILAAIWWEEMGSILIGMKSKGRIEILDQYLGSDGLDISQMLTPAKRR